MWPMPGSIGPAFVQGKVSGDLENAVKGGEETEVTLGVLRKEAVPWL